MRHQPQGEPLVCTVAHTVTATHWTAPATGYRLRIATVQQQLALPAGLRACIVRRHVGTCQARISTSTHVSRCFDTRNQPASTQQQDLRHEQRHSAPDGGPHAWARGIGATLRAEWPTLRSGLKAEPRPKSGVGPRACVATGLHASESAPPARSSWQHVKHGGEAEPA